MSLPGAPSFVSNRTPPPQLEAQYKAFFENTGAPTVIIEADATIALVNNEFVKLTGFAKEDVEGRLPFTELVAPRDRARLLQYHTMRRRDPASAPRTYECDVMTRNGEILHASATVSMIPGSDRSLACLIDATRLPGAEASLDVQRAYYRQLFERSPLAIALIDTDSRIVDVNHSFETLFGYSAEAIFNQRTFDILVPEDLREEAESIRASVLAGEAVRLETRRRRRDGETVPVSLVEHPVRIGETITGAYVIYTDISERKAFEKQLAHQAFHDALTGLPNRVLFLDRLERAMERAKRTPERRFAVLLIDLDRFKWVNDSLGHPAGDAMLCELAQRLSVCVRNMDTVARLGGDEFAILLEEIPTPREATTVAKRIRRAMAPPFVLQGRKIYSSASVGIVAKTADYATPADIVRDADIAMYRAKDAGKNRFKFFSPSMRRRARALVEMEGELRHALEMDQLTPYYQPIVDVATERLIGFEALARWRCADNSVLHPNAFIPIAEETGLIIPLGETILRKAAAQMRRWLAIIPRENGLQISVNLSAKQLQQADIVETVTTILREEGLEPGRLRLEITESVLVRDMERSLERLRQLKAHGVRLVIDDFGAGYSSLAYLQRFPVDVLKIDRAFVSDTARPENLQIVRTIISLAQSLGLRVVAEGVERQVQLDHLRTLHCDHAQGFMFSRPVDSPEAEALLLAAVVNNPARPAHSPDRPPQA